MISINSGIAVTKLAGCIIPERSLITMHCAMLG
jgi:hypothetical protein